jgi:ubiquinone/menaquinone biosynthesis C-methylase UbiE
MLKPKLLSMERESGWKQFKGKETPSTVQIHELFYKKVHEGSEVLDFGCAWGRIAFELQRKGYSVTGFDINGNAIGDALETARKTNETLEEKVKFHTANAMELPYPDKSFDACIVQAFLTTITSPEDRIKILSEAYRVLKDDGILYLADFGQNWENPYYRDRYKRDYPVTGEKGTFIVTDDSQPNKELFIAHHYTRAELINLVKYEFKVENFHETIFTTFHGNRTKGYIIIARKG